MISKSTIKLIKSLALKKYRVKENLFLVEGDKNVQEVLNSVYIVEQLFATKDYLKENQKLTDKANFVAEVEQSEIKKASLLQNPQRSLAICRLPKQSDLPKTLNNNLSVFLDEIQDPGNLGTIIRICDWFSIEYLFCSPNTADMFNPKVIQASMGSFSRVKVVRTEFAEVLQLARNTSTPIFGAFLEGQNIYQEELPERALLVVGNEGNGIGEEIATSIDKKIKIPEFKSGSVGAESLNVSVATAIICSEFKRQKFVLFIQSERRS